MKAFYLIIVILTLISCKSDDDSTRSINVVIQFTQNWDGVTVNASDLSATTFINQKGTPLNISRLRYLISRIVLKNNQGATFNIGGYHLIDISKPETLIFNTLATLPEGNYTLSFVYGFNEQDNQDGAYADLNAVSWNWPQMLGGGYHFLQMDGQYNVNTDPAPYNFHNGTARVSEGIFEQNFLVFNLPNTLNISASKNNLTIKMNIAEWFKNPITWDLEVLNTPLMPNYEAQKMMQQNASSVFSVTLE